MNNEAYETWHLQLLMDPNKLTDNKNVDDDKDDDDGRYSGGNSIIRICEPASSARRVTGYVFSKLVHNRRQV